MNTVQYYLYECCCINLLSKAYSAQKIKWLPKSVRIYWKPCMAHHVCYKKYFQLDIFKLKLKILSRLTLIHKNNNGVDSYLQFAQTGHRNVSRVLDLSN